MGFATVALVYGLAPENSALTDFVVECMHWIIKKNGQYEARALLCYNYATKPWADDVGLFDKQLERVEEEVEDDLDLHPCKDMAWRINDGGVCDHDQRKRSYLLCPHYDRRYSRPGMRCYCWTEEGLVLKELREKLRGKPTVGFKPCQEGL